MVRLLFASLLVVTTVAGAAPVTSGHTIAPFAITDQRDRGVMVDKDVRLILFSRDMTANKLAKSAFLDRPADFMPARHAVYLIDVSGMPSFVTNTFAIPKMRKYGYPILLDRDGKLTADLPNHKGEVTVMVVDRLKVLSIDYAKTSAALVTAVDEAGAAVATPAPQ